MSNVTNSTTTYDTSWFPYASSAVEVVLIAFHVSVFTCVAYSVRKGVDYIAGSPFFKIFLLKCLSDYVAYAIGTGVWRLKEMEIIGRISCKPLLISLNFLLMWSLFFQTAADTVISATRYTALAHPTHHLNLWTGLPLKCILLGMVLAPASVALAFVTLLFTASIDDPGVYLDFMAGLSMGFTVGCAIASAMMAFRALYVYMKLAHQRQKARREDYRLIVYAILSLTAQVALAAFFAIDALIEDNTDPVSQFVRRNFPYLVSFLSLASPFYLLSTCKSVRVVYARLFCGSFMPDPHDNNSTVVFTNSRSCKQTRVFVTQARPVNAAEPASYGFRGRRINTM